MVEQLPNIVQFFVALSPVPEQVYRSAEDLASRCSSATLSRHAAVGTAGGSSDDPDSFVSPNAAER